MKLIIAGSRHLEVSSIFINELINQFQIHATEIVSGGASGIDHCGEVYAKSLGLPVKVFPAEWEKHGNYAGPKRNGEMAKYADALLLIWNGESRGSHDMRRKMLDKKIYECVLRVME